MPREVTPTAKPGMRQAAGGWMRLWAALVCAACLGLLVLARRLEPNASGYGTHTQLGSGPCGMLVMTGYPCPSCGMTTAFAHAVRGELLRAFVAQPAGLVLALVTVAGVVISAWALVTGVWPRVGLAQISPFCLFAVLLLLLVGSWGFKIAYGLLRGELPLR